jgi:hypothetical protein
MLADPEVVHADLVREDGLLDDVADGLGVRKKIPLFVDGDIAERVQPQPRVAGR